VNTELIQHLQLAHQQVYHQLLRHLVMLWIEYVLATIEAGGMDYNTLSSSISHFRDEKSGNSVYVPIPQKPLWISL